MIARLPGRPPRPGSPDRHPAAILPIIRDGRGRPGPRTSALYCSRAEPRSSGRHDARAVGPRARTRRRSGAASGPGSAIHVPHAATTSWRSAARWPRRGCSRTMSTRRARRWGARPMSCGSAIDPARLSALWRQHGRIAFARGDQSRAIALLGRALKHAEQAHDSRAIGLAHFELGLCYRQVGDLNIVREQIAKATSALHAAGDRRHMALLHSLAGTSLAQAGPVRRGDGGTAAGRAPRHVDPRRRRPGHGVRQPGQRRDDAPPARAGPRARRAQRGHSRTQRIAARPGRRPRDARPDLRARRQPRSRAEQVLHRALDVRSPVQFHETTGAVFDSLAQIHLIRGEYDEAEQDLRAGGRSLRRIRPAGQPVVRVVRPPADRAPRAAARPARRGAPPGATDLIETPGVPPADLIQAHLIAAEALIGEGDGTRRRRATGRRQRAPRSAGDAGRVGRVPPAARRRCTCAPAGSPTRTTTSGRARASSTCSASGTRRAVSRLALCRLAAVVGARSMAERHLAEAVGCFEALGAAPDLEDAKRGTTVDDLRVSGPYLGSPTDADDAIVRRLVDAAVLPDLLAVETAHGPPRGVRRRRPPSSSCTPRGMTSTSRATSAATCRRRPRWPGRPSGRPRRRQREIALEPLGHHRDGPRFGAVVSATPIGYTTARRLRMIGAVARQGFDICAARERSAQTARTGRRTSRSKPLMPGVRVRQREPCAASSNRSGSCRATT